jgi:hypothetical protein
MDDEFSEKVNKPLFRVPENCSFLFYVQECGSL